MTLLLAAGTVWVCAALPLGVLLGRGIRLADERARAAAFSTDGVERYLREQAGAPLT
jgi:hypothetical protein